eukprot:Gb_24267 [translate_table: standard]
MREIDLVGYLLDQEKRRGDATLANEEIMPLHYNANMSRLGHGVENLLLFFPWNQALTGHLLKTLRIVFEPWETSPEKHLEAQTSSSHIFSPLTSIDLVFSLKSLTACKDWCIEYIDFQLTLVGLLIVIGRSEMQKRKEMDLVVEPFGALPSLLPTGPSKDVECCIWKENEAGDGKGSWQTVSRITDLDSMNSNGESIENPDRDLLEQIARVVDDAKALQNTVLTFNFRIKNE